MPKTEDVQKLREATGAGVMDSKRALEEAGGDFAEALEIIKKRGLAIAKEKSERAIKAGLIEAYSHNSRVGAILKLGCETDFVAKSEPFRELAHNLTMQITAMNPKDIDELLAQPFIKDERTTIDELIKQIIAKTGENIRLDSFHRLEL
ncbi:MAG: translation elongation factor Ts [Candidatus Colwellbacteria bacterium RBG_13_48_8]|uniref:Elongation factor Ts n=1 Tax=Candidatus Colwellbacteria bacterium RBG_13_48_8 TaxID=1797685 RepID=A0A1G1YXN2_9BACT|nr:MAG: translation elongation factor Ts [Candidatus Colwellbacteria bacterium RBG_13_48_8]